MEEKLRMVLVIMIREEIKRCSSGAKMTTEHTQLILLPLKHQKRSFFKAVIPQGPGQQGENSKMWAQKGRETSSAWPRSESSSHHGGGGTQLPQAQNQGPGPYGGGAGGSEQQRSVLRSPQTLDGTRIIVCPVTLEGAAGALGLGTSYIGTEEYPAL